MDAYKPRERNRVHRNQNSTRAWSAGESCAADSHDIRDFSARVLATGNLKSGAMNRSPASFNRENGKDRGEAIAFGNQSSHELPDLQRAEFR